MSNKIIIDNTDNTNNTKEIDNIYSNTNINPELIQINEFTGKINNLTKSDNKNDFVKNYNEYQKQIKLVDELLSKPNIIDPETDIKILFEMLNGYSHIINSNDINIKDYKQIVDIINIIETKIAKQKMNIKEISS